MLPTKWPGENQNSHTSALIPPPQARLPGEQGPEIARNSRDLKPPLARHFGRKGPEFISLRQQATSARPFAPTAPTHPTEAPCANWRNRRTMKRRGGF